MIFFLFNKICGRSTDRSVSKLLNNRCIEEDENEISIFIS